MQFPINRHWRRAATYWLVIAVSCPAFRRAQADDDQPAGTSAEQRIDALGDALPPAALLRFGTTRFRHPDDVGEMALSPDGKTVITIGREHLIVWDAETGRELWRALPAEAQIYSQGACYGQRLLTFSADSKHCYSPRRDGDIVRWDLSIGKYEVIDLPGERNLAVLSQPGAAAVDVTSDGKLLASGTQQAMVVCDPSGVVKYRILNQPVQAMGLNGKDRLTFGGHSSYVRFSHDGRRLATVLSESPQEIQLIETENGEELRRIALEQNLVRLDFSPDDQQIVATERDNATRLYSVETGERLWSNVIPPQGNAESYTCGVSYNHAGDLIAVCAPIGSDYGIRLLDSKNGEEVGKLEGHTWKPWHVAFSPDDQLLYSAGWDGPVRRWNVAERKQLPPPGGYRAGSGIAASPDGRWLAFNDDAGTVHLLDSTTYAEVRTMSLQGTAYEQLAFTPDSRGIAAGGTSGEDVHVALWDVADGALRQRWDWPKGRDPHSSVEALDFHPAGEWLGVAVFRQGTAYLLDVASGLKLAEMKHPQVYGLAFSPDGEAVATVGWDKRICTWNARTGESTHRLTVEAKEIPNADSRMYGVAYARSGGLIATAHMSGFVSVWNREWELLQRFDAGWFTFGAITFSADGSLLATGSAGGEVRVWDPLTGEKLWDRGRHEHYVFAVGFTRDGMRLCSSGSDNVSYVWDLAPESVSEELSPDEKWHALSGDGATACQATWQLVRAPDEATTLLRDRLLRVETLVDLDAALQGLTGDEAVRRRELSRLMVAKNDSLSFGITVRRAIGILVRIHSPAARASLERIANTSASPDVRQLAQEALLTF